MSMNAGRNLAGGLPLAAQSDCHAACIKGTCWAQNWHAYASLYDYLCGQGPLLESLRVSLSVQPDVGLVLVVQALRAAR